MFDYQVDGVTLTRVNHVTDLGVQLDSKLTFDLQREAIISKATRQLGFISKVAKDFSLVEVVVLCTRSPIIGKCVGSVASISGHVEFAD